MTRRLLDPDEALRRLETRLGPFHAQLRLGMEREHETQAFGQGLSFLHLENLPLMQAMIEIALRVTGTYWRGRANAREVQVRRNVVRNLWRWVRSRRAQRYEAWHVVGPNRCKVAEPTCEEALTANRSGAWHPHVR